MKKLSRTVELANLRIQRLLSSNLDDKKLVRKVEKLHKIQDDHTLELAVLHRSAAENLPPSGIEQAVQINRNLEKPEKKLKLIFEENVINEMHVGEIATLRRMIAKTKQEIHDIENLKVEYKGDIRIKDKVMELHARQVNSVLLVKLDPLSEDENDQIELNLPVIGGDTTNLTKKELLDMVKVGIDEILPKRGER